MSSILKALRRLEEDRARKSDNVPTIATSLLRSHSHRRSSVSSPWFVAFLVVAALSSLLLLWPKDRTSTDSHLTPAKNSLLPPQSQTLPIQTGRRLIMEEVIPPRPLAPSAVTQNKASLSDKVVPPPLRVEAKEGSSLSPGDVSVETYPERQSPAVSAIAWQETSAARMAVIDDLPVMSGETIHQAKVVEIQPDYVIFEEEGLRFIVRLQSP